MENGNRKLVEYGGDGFCGQRENGQYKVVFGEESKVFGKLSEAKKFYDGLKCEKAIWSVNGLELLDAMVYEFEYEGPKFLQEHEDKKRI